MQSGVVGGRHFVHVVSSRLGVLGFPLIGFGQTTKRYLYCWTILSHNDVYLVQRNLICLLRTHLIGPKTLPAFGDRRHLQSHTNPLPQLPISRNPGESANRQFNHFFVSIPCRVVNARFHCPTPLFTCNRSRLPVYYVQRCLVFHRL